MNNYFKLLLIPVLLFPHSFLPYRKILKYHFYLSSKTLVEKNCSAIKTPHSSFYLCLNSGSIANLLLYSKQPRASQLLMASISFFSSFQAHKPITIK